MAYEAGSRAEDFAEAIAHYETAIDLDPGKSLYHGAVAAVHFKRYEKTHEQAAAMVAIAELKRAIELNPLDGRLPGLLGHVYLVLSASPSAAGNPSQAVSLQAARSAYERAAVLEPFMPSHRLALGQVYLALGDPRTAEEQVRHAIEIEPNFLPARGWLTRRYFDSGRAQAALREYDEIVRRQSLYAARPKDTLEERYLTVDHMSLRSMIEPLRGRT
jgi:tetratricopeptide (TPR) repeat protein